MKLRLRKDEQWWEERISTAKYCFGGGGGSTTSTATNINYSPEEAARRTQVMDEAQRIYGASSLASQGYPGAAPVPVSADTYAGQQLTRQGAQQIMGATQQTMQGNNLAAGAVGQGAAVQNAQNNIMANGLNYGMNGAMDVQNNPYLASAMQAAIRPVTESYTDPGGVMSQIRTNAASTGQYGGSRQGIAEGVAGGRYAQAIGDIVAKMGSAGYDQGQKTFSAALGQIPAWMNANQGATEQALNYQKNLGSNLQNITAAAQAPGAMYSGVGAQNENIAKEWADYAANQRMWDMNAPWIPLQNYAGIVYGGSAPSTEASMTSSGGTRNALGQVVGTGLTAASLYGMMGA